MLQIAFLCSGSGGNLRFLAQAIEHGLLTSATICGVLTDRECPASQFARERKISTREIDFSDPEQRILIRELHGLAPNVVVTNIHRILVPQTVEAFRGSLVNLHYSLLPAFGGVIGSKPVMLALEYGAKFVGVTVHLVDTKVDAGRPLFQVAIPVREEDTTDSLMDVVFRCGCVALLNAIQALRTDAQQVEHLRHCQLEVSGRETFFSPEALHSPEFEDESFWRSVKSRAPGSIV